MSLTLDKHSEWYSRILVTWTLYSLLLSKLRLNKLQFCKFLELKKQNVRLIYFVITPITYWTVTKCLEWLNACYFSHFMHVFNARNSLLSTLWKVPLRPCHLIVWASQLNSFTGTHNVNIIPIPTFLLLKSIFFLLSHPILAHNLSKLFCTQNI
jgi:hypothetical protein